MQCRRELWENFQEGCLIRDINLKKDKWTVALRFRNLTETFGCMEEGAALLSGGWRARGTTGKSSRKGTPAYREKTVRACLPGTTTLMAEVQVGRGSIWGKGGPLIDSESKKRVAVNLRCRFIN